MSYTRTIGDMTVFINCVSNPEHTYETYYKAIKERIVADGYMPETTIDNLITMIVLYFDCDDNYGVYDEGTGFGGYGEKFTLEECFRYVEENGGYKEFDYYA